ncbi:hypothetical protein JG688_00013509 [Phytophthora aleatoria]|uniref:Uncharacterized protein n=1 Tax=Phytophthora aleatoria TaxID=2496075 RepID=A0A8J5M3Y7_9STRA|nr:hypothetical protein JG688_00013509 [Phytophthora aleatoria]
MFALYATVTNHAGSELLSSKEVVSEANRHKRAIYALMIANLVEDVNLGVVSPLQETRKLYPAIDAPPTPSATLALLCTHLLHERVRSVAAPVPQVERGDHAAEQVRAQSCTR